MIYLWLFLKQNIPFHADVKQKIAVVTPVIFIKSRNFAISSKY